jgi:hypothetical protein
MGMDVYGKNPSAPEGEYFRNNVWHWRPLAIYVQEVAPDITSHCKYWHSNDGDGLNKARSVKLADKLMDEILAGRTKAYEEALTARIAALPRKECWLCQGTGVRSDAIGMSNGFVDRIVTADNRRKGQRGWCNACEGDGTLAHDESHYPFSTENVLNFAKFLLKCGGFEIC